ncbi:MAG: aconitase family protein, partial [Rikenellaceae bacterium]
IELTGEFYKETIMPKSKKANASLIPIKKGFDVSKYGGYTGVNKAYSVILEFDGKKKREKKLVGVPVEVVKILSQNENSIIEYFGDGASTISASGKATICNMGAEVGATTSIFPYDENTAQYLLATSRKEITEWVEKCKIDLMADEEVLRNPEKYYDRVIEINLSAIEPHLNGPFTPDAANRISEFARVVAQKNYPDSMEVGLIGSCTNSSYQDLMRAADLAEQAFTNNIDVKAQLIINPGSALVYNAALKAGAIEKLKKVGATIMANACGPCIGQWNRSSAETADDRKNSIVTSFNRNFAKRADGNPNTYAFVASPEIVMALTIAGSLSFNPLTDTLKNRDGKKVKLRAPAQVVLPMSFSDFKDIGYAAPSADRQKTDVMIAAGSQRLQRLQPFDTFHAASFQNMALLIKVAGKCTTDHISMAGKWLRFRGHIDNISDNLLLGAINSFNGKSNSVLNPIDKSYGSVSSSARALKAANIASIIVAEDNYGEGSSREHAAMEPRHLGVRVVLTKSFARIHETNLKKQGILALTFADVADYNKIREDDRFSIACAEQIAPGKPLSIEVSHVDGTKDIILALHTYNHSQIDWLKAGSALNYNAKRIDNGKN